MITPVLTTENQGANLSGYGTGIKQVNAINAPNLGTSQEATGMLSKQVTNSLAGFVRMHWERAKAERITSGIEDRMIRAKQARDLVYDNKKQAEIQALLGADYEPPYMPLTLTKCKAAEDWIMDVLFQAGTRPFGIENTPEPEVPQDVVEGARVLYGQQIAQQVLDQHMQQGSEDYQGMDAEVQAQIKKQSDVLYMQIKQVAKELTEKFEGIVDDRLTLGGWYNALKEIVYDITTYPAAFMKGPEEQMINSRKRDFSPQMGRYLTYFSERKHEKYSRVSPVNIYPLVGSRTCDDGLIERAQFTPIALQTMLGVDGFDQTELRAVLKEAEGGGLREWTAIDSQVAILDNKTANILYMGDLIDALIFWGQAPGRLLVQWGINRNGKQVIEDEDKWYHVYAMLIGNHVVMARLNPNPDGKTPYYKASWVDDPDKFWNTSLPDILWPHQSMANAIARACGMNAAMASGPIIEQDIERCADRGPLHPYKRFYSTDEQFHSGNPAIRLYTIPLIVVQLSRFYNEFLMTQADYDSGVPRISHGGQSGGAGVTSTASGTSMFLSQSSRGIKGVIGHIDKGIVEKSVTAEYYYILDSVPDIKLPAGDMVIEAKGSTAMIVKEQAVMRMKEFLKETNNPTDMQIIGAEGRRTMLRDAMKTLPIDVDKVLPEEAELINQLTNGGLKKPQPGVPEAGMPAQPESGTTALAPDGSPAGGQDTALFTATA
jgi:ribosomal protein S17E